jgi:hypothetical protein
MCSMYKLHVEISLQFKKQVNINQNVNYFKHINNFQLNTYKLYVFNIYLSKLLKDSALWVK